MVKRNFNLVAVLAVVCAVSCAGGEADENGGEAEEDGGFSTSAAKDPKVTLKNLPLNEELESLPFDEERVLKKANTYQYDLASLVGHALFLTKDSTGNCMPATGNTYDAIYISPESYLKPDTKLEPKTINNVIYDHKVDNGASAAFNVFVFAATLTKDKLAQVTVTDAAFLNIPNNSLVTDYVARIRQGTAVTGCAAVLLLGAKVRVATYRYFNRETATGGINAAAFSANGKVYAEEALSRNEVAVSVTGSIVYPTAGPARPLDARDASVLPRVLTVDTASGFKKLDRRAIDELRRRRVRPIQ